MVKVTNGVETFTIPEGAASVYKNMGFVPENVKVVKKVEKKPVDDSSEEVDVFGELLSRPISQWNQEEVKEFAAAKGYDVSGAKSLKQAKAIIKEALDEEERMTSEE